MLYRFLQAIYSGKAHNFQEIAQTLGISLDMAQRIARDLNDKGYLHEMNDDCSSTHDSCSHCAMGGSCQVQIAGWYLTEKGLTALSAL